jgi:hypothetical protein
MPKKLLLLVNAVILAAALGAAEPAAKPEPSAAPVKPEESGFWEKFGRSALFYLPNRLCDLSDMYSVTTSFGMPSLYCGATELCRFGADGGDKYFIEKTWHRKYPKNFYPDLMGYEDYLCSNLPCGAGKFSGMRAGFFCWSAVNEKTESVSGKVTAYSYNVSGVPSWDDKVFAEKTLDFWDIGASAGFGWNFGFFLHPMEIADFAAGFFLIDLSGDDLPGSSALTVQD